MLWNKDDRGMTQRYDASAKATQELGVTVQPLGVREPDGFNEAFATMNREMPDAMRVNHSIAPQIWLPGFSRARSQPICLSRSQRTTYSSSYENRKGDEFHDTEQRAFSSRRSDRIVQ
jgi:hypothetical protein